MSEQTSLFGFLNINKAPGLTSHDVVAHLRRAARHMTGQKVKVGHAGTLDPMATGVLIICIGPATRLSEYVMASTKRYVARVRLGISTDTEDAEGEVIASQDASGISQMDVENLLPQFIGAIEQIPPMYSAIKQDGRKLYELARKGETVERKARHVVIEQLQLRDWSDAASHTPEFTLEITCSAGTYIRSLARDIGDYLGVGAHLSGLVRSASGNFMLENAHELDKIMAASDWAAMLIEPQSALRSLPVVHLNASDMRDIVHGRTISRDAEIAEDVAQALAPDGRFAAILKAGDGIWRPHKVFLHT